MTKADALPIVQAIIFQERKKIDEQIEKDPEYFCKAVNELTQFLHRSICIKRKVVIVSWLWEEFRCLPEVGKQNNTFGHAQVHVGLYVRKAKFVFQILWRLHPRVLSEILDKMPEMKGRALSYKIVWCLDDYNLAKSQNESVALQMESERRSLPILTPLPIDKQMHKYDGIQV